MSFVLPADHPCLPGHFPGLPLVPGVVLLEQAVAAIEAMHGPLPALRLPQVKFLQPLRPGESAEVEIEQLAPGRWRFRLHRGAELLASGEIASAAAREPA